MKKLPVIWAVIYFFLVLAGQCWAGDCLHVVSEATGTSDSPLGQYSGTATVTIDGQSIVAEVTATPTAASGPTEDGTLHLETVTQFYFAVLDSWLDTIETIVLSPTDEAGVYRVNSRMIITGGTGQFSESFGKLLPHGYITFINPEFEVVAKGKICFD